MAAPKRKPAAQFLTSAALLGMLAQLSTSKFFEIIIHTPDDYADLEDLFVTQLGRDMSFLQPYTRVTECALLLDSREYQQLVTELCGDKEFARATGQYIQCVEFQEGELCVLNLFRQVHKRLKTTPARKKRLVSAPKNTGRRPQPSSASETSAKQCQKLETLIEKALEAEDYLQVLALKKQLDELRGS